MNLEKFMENQFPHLNFLTVSTEKFIPGVVLENLKGNHVKGHIKSIVKGQPANYWDTDKVKGNLLHGQNLQGSGKLGSNVSVLNFINVKADAGRQYSYEYSLTEIKASNFLNTSELDLFPLLKKIKSSSSDEWKQIKKYFIVMETFYATKFEVVFKKGTQVATKVDIKNDLNISAGVDYDVQSNGKIIVGANETIPFAFNAFQIKNVK